MDRSAKTPVRFDRPSRPLLPAYAVSLSLALSLARSLFRTLARSLSLYFSRTLSLSLAHPLSLVLSFSISLALSLSRSLSSSSSRPFAHSTDRLVHDVPSESIPIQGYLAQTKQPPHPKDPHRTLGIVLL